MDVTELARLASRVTASHGTAARLWCIELVGEPGDRLTVPLARSRLVVPGSAVRGLDLPADDIVVVNEVWRTTPQRAVLDLARVLPPSRPSWPRS